MKCISFSLLIVPTSPLNFELSVVTSTLLMASWSPPNPVRGHITAYTVYCNSSAQQAYPEISNSVVLASITVDGDSTMMSIPELTPFTSYDCHVTASTSIGEGSPSNTATARTAEAGTCIHACIVVNFMTFYNNICNAPHSS